MTRQTLSQDGAAQVRATPAPIVSVQGYGYRVDLGRRRYHFVRKDRSCACDRGEDCPAVRAVADYLRAGGTRAPDPPPGFWLEVPDRCPVCGGPTAADRALDSRRHGRGWRCPGDPSHHWQCRAQALIAAQREAYAASPDYPGLPGVARMAPDGRSAFLQAHGLTYAATA